MLTRINPSSIRGGIGRSRFFEGWFQKLYSREHRTSFVIIYGYATGNAHDMFGFIQVLIPGQEPALVYFPKGQVVLDRQQHIVRMGDNVLSTNTIDIHLHELSINLQLMNNQRIETLNNSMGYAYYVPTLPCYHSVLNTSHGVSGSIVHRSNEYAVNNEMGYLEKNWGTSFPDRYTWLHAVDPNNAETSLLFSRADIQWLGRTFTRHVGHIRFDGKHIDLRSLSSVVISTHSDGTDVHIYRIKSASLQLDITVTVGHKVLLKAPEKGSLSREIPHHIDALIEARVTHDGVTRAFNLVGNYENVG